jgi:cytochrome b561
VSEADQRYNRGARALHWLIALLVIANLLTGIFHNAVEDMVRVIPTHKSTGITILALSVARILWRLTWRHPAYPETVRPWEALTARGVQAVFYGLMIVMPLTGWIIASAGKYPLDWFGVFALPKLAITREGTAYAIGHEAHELLGWLFAGLVVLHVAAALRHHFILKNDVLRRMT